MVCLWYSTIVFVPALVQVVLSWTIIWVLIQRLLLQRLRNHLHLTQPVDSASSSPVNQLVSRLVELTSDIQRQFHFPQIVAIYAQQVSYLIPEYVWWANSFYDTY